MHNAPLRLGQPLRLYAVPLHLSSLSPALYQLTRLTNYSMFLRHP